jgi:CheY-like chemotaxis protein
VAGAEVMVAIGDTGVGMSDEIRERAFEPFFTTKRSGAGTGLGLSMVYGFVTQSGGHIEISSEPGIGTTVRIYLPRALTDAPSEEASPVLPTAPAGKETILVVEDDADVREYVVNVLELLGYSVIEAGDGPSALALLDANNVDVDLMFTDVVLPGGMSGKDVADAAQKDRPDLKVLFTSGYSEDVIVHHGRLDEGVDLLPKPYTQKHLAQRIRQALGGAQD